MTEQKGGVRKIKFGARLKNVGPLLNVVLIDFNANRIIVETVNSWITTVLSESTLIQFTGLKDKNGKEIWEGDILRQHYSDKGETTLAQVEFWMGGFMPFTDCECTSSRTICAVEVIGNIYENPDLLSPPTTKEKAA